MGRLKTEVDIYIHIQFYCHCASASSVGVAWPCHGCDEKVLGASRLQVALTYPRGVGSMAALFAKQLYTKMQRLASSPCIMRLVEGFEKSAQDIGKPWWTLVMMIAATMQQILWVFCSNLEKRSHHSPLQMYIYFMMAILGAPGKIRFICYANHTISSL